MFKFAQWLGYRIEVQGFRERVDYLLAGLLFWCGKNPFVCVWLSECVCLNVRLNLILITEFNTN